MWCTGSGAGWGSCLPLGCWREYSRKQAFRQPHRSTRSVTWSGLCGSLPLGFLYCCCESLCSVLILIHNVVVREWHHLRARAGYWSFCLRNPCGPCLYVHRPLIVFISTGLAFPVPHCKQQSRFQPH